LQRRFASSIFAVRRSLERMKERREKILADPNGYRQEIISKKLPEDFDDLPEEERQDIIAQLEEVVASVDPVALKEEIFELSKLIEQAQSLEQREVESKLVKLRGVLTDHNLFDDPKMKLLIFTEHKDTLDYLVSKLRQWGLTVMKIGDRDTPGSRIYAEQEFRDECQVLVATEAAGEGINLQFCWFMINYDIPWNPVRLEQRMGRIHRYGQEKDCLIFNFVVTNTREGRVLQKLFERIRKIEDDLDPKRTGKIFNVLGDAFPANMLERMVRDMYAHNQTDQAILDRIIEETDVERFRKITNSTLEGLAKRELNLSAIVGKSAEAKERRLVPEVIEDFFTNAAPLSGIQLRTAASNTHVYTVGRVPRTLWNIGEQLEGRFGKLAKQYKNIVFDKKFLTADPTLEWVTPGHSLFECVREDVFEQVQPDLQNGSVFFDLHSKNPYRLDVYSTTILDGRTNVLHRRLFVVQTDMDCTMSIRQPTIFLDLTLAPAGQHTPSDENLPGNQDVEHALIEKALKPFLSEVAAQREKETAIISRHLEISLNELINRQNLRHVELLSAQDNGDNSPLQAANIKTTEDRLFELNGRLERRREELQQERNCTINDIKRHGRAWVLPHPDRDSPSIAPMVRDDEIERIAVQKVTEYEQARGWTVQSVEKENRGFDLISHRASIEDPLIASEIRFIEVKGRAGVGEVALTSNEYKTAERLRSDYWLYVVYDCGNEPTIHAIKDPIRLGWEPLVRIEHYHVNSNAILGAGK